MTSATLVISNLTVTYNNGHTALRNASLTLQGGMLCALLGINGSGKSTLFKSIIGMVKPSDGFIRLNGFPVKKALRQSQVAYVPQNEDIDWNFPVLVDDVVMMGRYGKMSSWLRRPSKEDYYQVDQALSRVGLKELRRRQIGELSGGQKKRVFLARALAQQAQVLLLDEPFTGIDNQTEDNIITLLQTLRDEKRLILISTHNIGKVPYFCDWAVLINEILVDSGPISDIFTIDNLQRTFGSTFFPPLSGVPNNV
ncbi:ATP-binding cassette domain-containing protein [Candidatus Curculioniphilus buchneri]|uniref:ATP-binding cassette domain-containing protein n=1 Tax=Candidatus Curculioniphilus buchneri TaxID=690594 RepID=UPI00376F34CB